MKKNDVLKKYIINKYGSVSKFLKKEKFPQQHLEIMLDKRDVFHQIGIGLKVCGFLNIDAAKLFCGNEIAAAETGGEKNQDADMSGWSIDEIIKEKYARLSEDERKKTLEYANDVFENMIL